MILLTEIISPQKKPPNSFLEQEQHYVKHDGTSATGLETDHNELTTFDANQKAIEALQLLLRKLPNKLAAKDNAIQTIDDDNIIPDTKLQTPQHITQYNIPKDPYIPKFKPIKQSVTSTYTFKLGPIDGITQDTYGGSEIERKPSIHHAQPPPPPSYLIQKTINGPELNRHLVPPSIDSVSATFSQSSPSPLISQSAPHAIEAQPLDLYHTMTLKNVDAHPQVQSLPYLPPQKQSHVPQFEIQKSIEYQLH